MMECVNTRDGGCQGDVHRYRSRSGATVSARCEAHQAAYDKRMDELEAGLQERYPGYNIPGSPPPPGFDPSYAGERWDEDD